MFRYFSLQFYNQCYCDNANIASLGTAPESECDTPCNGHDGSNSEEIIMCGGTWRNSVYEVDTNNWEAAGYDDTMWESAKVIGPNGVAPWYHRPDIGDDAEWICASIYAGSTFVSALISYFLPYFCRDAG